MASARILIIEDNPANMELMAYLLSAFGHQPLTASDGESGVRIAREQRPDLIVCDVYLPKLDGYGVVRALRQDPALARVPMLAVTALAMDGDRQQLLEAGFDGYVSKPIEPDRFVAELEEWLPPDPAQPDGAPAPDSPATILIVDDHVLNREFLITLLGFGGHRLLSASSGQEGLDLAARQRPDLVIADVLMPAMDGYDFVTLLHARPDTAAVPVIFYTAAYREEEAEKMAAACGVRWVLPKPSDPDLIVRTVHEALGRQAPTVPAPGVVPTDQGTLGGIGHAVHEMIGELQTGARVLSHFAAEASPVADSGNVGFMTDRLADSLSSLQAVSLRLTALIDLGIALGAEREPLAVLRVGCKLAQDICVARYACVAVLREDGSGTAQVAVCGDDVRIPSMAGNARAGVLGSIIDSAQPVRRSGLEGDPSRLGLPPGHPPLHSFLGVPLLYRERVCGWLYLADKVGPDGFTEVDERVAATVAAQLAVAYQNLQLYEEIKLHHAQLKADMAARLRLDEELRRFRTAMDATADAIFLIDRTAMRFVDVNATACAMLGFERDEFLNVEGQALDAAPAPLRRLYELLEAAEQGGAVEEAAVTHRTGRELAVEVQCRTLRSGSGWMRVAVVRDISERKDNEKRLLKLAHYDTLTGLPNRLQFKAALARAVDQARENGWSGAVLLLDIDRFKTINDTLGHAVGDRLLQQFATRVVDCLRMRDTVGRFGGDEFGAVLMLPEGPRNALIVVDKLREAMRKPFHIEGHELILTASIGAAVYPDDAGDAETLIKYADNAMSRAKADAGGGFRFFTAEMNAQSMARLDLEHALRRALEHGEFVLHYQPKVSTESGRISGAEALLRWQRPGHGMVSPALFIPVLEETGMIVQVGQWVLEEACRQIAAWSRAGTPVQVSVNVSGVQFFVGGLEEDVKAAIGRHAISPELLELELTETSVMSNAEGTIAVLRNLKALGIQISVDDFGTGYSSLAYLKRFPIDKLKIDIAFVREVTSNPDDAAIVLAIINMAHSMNLKVVAEGVEREAQLAYLRRHGCDEIQGYYFSRPIDPPAFETLLAQGQALEVPGEAPDETKPTLLIVDDDAFMLEVLSDFLSQDGYRILTAQSAAEGFDILARYQVQVILCDQCMPLMSGTEFMERVKSLAPGTFRIMLSAYADLTPIIAAINQGAIDRFYTKPWRGAVLRENIREGFRLSGRHGGSHTTH